MVRLKKKRTRFFWPHPWRLLRGLQQVDWLLETKTLNKNVYKKTSLVLLGRRHEKIHWKIIFLMGFCKFS